MNDNHMKVALENIARRGVPENINLWPRISVRLDERKSFMQTMRTRPLLMILIIVLIFLALTGVAYAIGRAAGYIPGVGIVDQSAPLRMLAEPVSVTRDGVTITVKDAVLSSDKTVIVFTVENIPLDKFPHNEGVLGCIEMPEILLKDGTLLQVNSNGGKGWGTGYESRSSYGRPIPANVNEVTLVIPCIAEAQPGVLPENWKLPLRFVPAPPNMTLIPVIEITPSPASDSTTGTVTQNLLSITKVIDTGDSYILIGEFQPPAPSQDGDWMLQGGIIKLSDANGQEVFYDFPQDIDFMDLPSTGGPKVDVWAIKFSKGFAPPIHISYPYQYVLPDSSHATYEFEFDAGPNPQEGQTWELNKEIQMAGHTFTLVSIQAQAFGTGYNFEFMSSDHSIQEVSVSIDGYTPTSGEGGGGGGGSDQPIGWEAGLNYAELPKGKLKVILSGLYIYSETKNSTVDWQPSNSSSNIVSTPTEASQSCLTADSWQAALSSPAPIPIDLTGKVIGQGRVMGDGKSPSDENYGVYVANLDGSNRQVIGKGTYSWPALSPDGTKAVFSNGGLYLVELATGEGHYIPNTNDKDVLSSWSPDGKSIAFLRTDDSNLYVINPDGTNLKKVTDGIEEELPIDWSPDGANLLFGIGTRNGYLLRKVELTSGVVTDLFTTKSKGLIVSLSPDGQHIAFSEPLGYLADFGLFVSSLDGSARKLIAQMGQWATTHLVWSPDGNWLIVSILNTDNLAVAEEVPALVNLKTCQIVPLPLSGRISSWVQ